MTLNLTRREALLGAGALVASGAAARRAPAQDRPQNEPFGYCLNTSTLQMGQKISVAEEIDVAAAAGFTAVEPWIMELQKYVEKGGSLKDLEKRLRDKGVTVESAIGFAQWIVDDDAARAKGLETMKRDMDLVAQIGGKRIAAPPAGNNTRSDLDLRKAADRYRAILELGDTMGVVPECEVWGSSKCLNKLSEAAFIAIESGHPKACILADIYHLYKGGSSLETLRLLHGDAMHVIHTNDYPADPPRETVTDAHRVYPGDGVAPLGKIFQTLKSIGYRGYLSVELFNREYWKAEPAVVAKTAFEKTRAAVRKAFA
jgi:sugar phosphate isomerase/epimerase